MDTTLEWLLASPEPWTRYRTLVDLLDCPLDDPQVQAARAEMLAHPQIQGLLEAAAQWGARPLKRHNDSSHPLYALSTLADLGLRAGDPGLAPILEAVLAHQSTEGAFETLVFIPRAFGGRDEEQWAWLACDAPTLLYALQAFGLEADERAQKAAEHLASLVDENGYRCTAAPDLGRFRGPGKRGDPCPIANVYALKALSLSPAQRYSSAASQAAETLLEHWERQKEQKYYLFGIGRDFRKLKYPFVWYDLLHVCEVLSRFPPAHADPRFREILAALLDQADEAGRYTASSMYKPWQGWSFADKKTPSAWLTFLVRRIEKRVGV